MYSGKFKWRLRSAMKAIDGSQFRHGPRLAEGHGAHQSWQQFDQTKTTAKAVGGFCHVAPRVHGLTHGLIAAAAYPFDVAEHHIHPASSPVRGGDPTAIGFQHGVRMTLLVDAPSAAQPVAEDFRVDCQVSPDPVGECGVLEASYRLDHGGGEGLRRQVGGHGDDERRLVIRVVPRLAAVALTAEIGIVDLQETRELVRFLALGHDLHDRVLQLTGDDVARAQVALRLPCGHGGLATGQQVHGQEQCRQRQRAALEHRAAGQRGLMAASAVRVAHPACMAKPRGGLTAAPGAAEALWPTHPVQRPIELGLRAIPLDELRHRQPRLKLHRVQGHDGSPSRNLATWPHRVRLTLRDSWLIFVANHVGKGAQRFKRRF